MLAATPDGTVAFVAGENERMGLASVSLDSAEVSKPFATAGWARFARFAVAKRLGPVLAVGLNMGSAQRYVVQVLSWPSSTVR